MKVYRCTLDIDAKGRYMPPPRPKGTYTSRTYVTSIRRTRDDPFPSSRKGSKRIGTVGSTFGAVVLRCLVKGLNAPCHPRRSNAVPAHLRPSSEDAKFPSAPVKIRVGGVNKSAKNNFKRRQRRYLIITRSAVST
jgi:hypothetical protein